MKTIKCVLLLVIAFCFILSSQAFGGEKALLFHAGLGQRGALNEVKAVFEKENPEIKVNFSYKGSGYFIADITRSRQGDLFMPGEEFYLMQAVERGFLTNYNPKTDIPAYFVTVIITPAGNPKNIKCIEDFAKPGVRVGLGNPKSCAIGIWHQKTFGKAGIWDKVKANATLSAKCIPELGNATQHRAIDGTIVWATTAVLYLRDVEIIPIEQQYRGIIRLPVGVLKFARYKEEAQQLMDYILSDEGRAIFHKHAYAINPVIPVDKNGFCLDGTTDKDMEYLVNAAKAVKDESFPVNKDTVGDLIEEVERQKKTVRAGD
ncbi:MAG TPA: molybdate ABC transporter substrate-binding protein [Desulfobacteraceae bacterium]|nr:molybdate ABC transporter substrate-binding protein [Desulfobacteraceae bacterium]HPJ68221.1 molybdate ABC transporter substrate-binding protein [Desulfobacteraceae bacterium]HPQ26887.1 molybdate ABC transporter substrate-binding protein [Desulfobacteraceae bacterium]